MVQYICISRSWSLIMFSCMLLLLEYSYCCVVHTHCALGKKGIRIHRRFRDHITDAVKICMHLLIAVWLYRNLIFYKMWMLCRESKIQSDNSEKKVGSPSCFCDTYVFDSALWVLCWNTQFARQLAHIYEQKTRSQAELQKTECGSFDIHESTDIEAWRISSWYISRAVNEPH